MSLRKLIAIPVLAAFAAAAPAAHAVTTTTPLLAAPTGAITPTGKLLTFKSFDAAFKTANGIPLTAVLNDVLLNTRGTTGGSTTALNYSPNASAFATPAQFNLSANTSQNGVATPNSGAAIPAGIFTPPFGPFTPGTGMATITAQTQNRGWSVFAGPFNFTAPSTLSLSVASSYTPTFTVGGPFVSADNSTFTLSTTLADTYLTYDWSLPAAVPGPLPLVGGMTAFAFSRRLRQRISSAAS
jgi:hypothetical protein